MDSRRMSFALDYKAGSMMESFMHLPRLGINSMIRSLMMWTQLPYTKGAMFVKLEMIGFALMDI